MAEALKRPGGELASRPLHFFWVVDCSGSMYGEKIGTVNHAIQSTIPEMVDAAKDTQQFSENAFEESDDDKSPLLEKYLAQLSTSLDFSFAGDRYGWVEEIEKPELIKGIKALSKEDIELITLYVFDDLTQNEIGVRFGISQKAVSKRIEQIRKHLNKFS